MSQRGVARAGAWCLGAGLVGAVQAAVLLGWPEQVAEDRYSYPFTAGGHVLAQVSFFLQHLPLVIALAALLTLPGVRASRAARGGVITAVVGMALLTAMELVTTSAADVAVDSSRATLVNNLYGPPTILIGVGLVVAGIAMTRTSAENWRGARRLPLLVLLLGVFVFVPLTPAIMGPFAAGRLAIGAWLLLFAGLGYALRRLELDPSTDSPRHDGDPTTRARAGGLASRS